MAYNHHRIYTFDLLRGFAVLAMMLAHSVYFFHNRESAFLLSVEGFGNTVSFVTFLLVSGAVASVAYFSGNPSEGHVKRKRVFSRVLLLLLAYYILALFLVGADLLRAEGFARLRLVLDILLFRHLPGFTEYFPPFIFYSALLALVPRLIRVAIRTLKNVFVVSVVSLLAGFALYRLPVGDFLQPWVALFSGAEGVYRFPLLHYLPVFLFGLYWGKLILESRGLQEKRKSCFRFFAFFALVVTTALLASFAFGVPLESTFSRWPPSVPFLALGLGFAFLLATLLYALHQLRRAPLLRDTLLTFGQNALGIFWSHIFLLGLYATTGGAKASSPLIYFFLFLLLVLLSLALTTFLPFNFRLALTSIRRSHEEEEEALADEAIFRLSKDVAAEAVSTTRGLRSFFFPDSRATGKRVLRKRHKLGISLVALAAAALIFPSTTEELALQRQQKDAGVWWSDTYAYRQQVTLQNPDPFITLPASTTVTITFNHKTPVEEGKSRPDGLDVRLVYWNGTERVGLESSIVDLESDPATLRFRVPVKLEGGKQNPFFYLYYGGFIVSPTQPTTPPEGGATILARFGTEESYPLVARVSKRWSLIGEEGSDTVALHLTTAESRESQTATYQVLGTDLSGSMIRSVDTSWEADIPVETLRPGAYQVQATLYEGENGQRSQVTGFYRSYPLYVAWTEDWEGYDVNEAYLDAIEAIANQYHLPITHFFNPRIYVTESIAPARAQSLTEWVKRRIALGDRFGLHLHMFTDFVEQAGVEPRIDPNWGDNGSGYGVPLTAYTKSEQVRLIQNALNLLVANGFSRTDLFRSGGWYINLDTLAALEDLGFRADSSARTQYQFGRNHLPGYWDILPTMRPYHPSRTNQNRSSGTKDFSVLEIPNNGADSYAYSAQAMVDRFTVNLGLGTLSSRQQVTYLSHPHWFDEKEQARVRELFEFVSRYTFSNDRGPAIFTTTDAIADIWANDE